MTTAATLSPLDVLLDDAGPATVRLPAELARLHGGPLDIPELCMYANFVATLDGVVAIPDLPRSNEFIAGGSEADRFLMGLLRAFADVVLIGAGVLRASPRGTWRPEGVYPPVAEAYAQLRQELGISAAPEVAVVTGSGSIDPGHPLLASGALVLTSEAGAARLDGSLPAASSLVALGADAKIPPRSILDVLHERGHGRILCEAGPHTFGALVQARVVDELFLTTSPMLVGEAGPGSRLRLVENADLVPSEDRFRLLSVRRSGSHLFRRYALRS